MKSRAGPDYEWWERERGRSVCERRKRLGSERGQGILKHTLSVVKPRFFALTVWEPSIGRANAHVHDKVEF